MKTFLHVGCGPKRKNQTTRGFNTPDWTELRLDIDAGVAPDIILKPDGFLVVTCPDLQEVCRLVAEDKLLEPAYTSPAGPITPLDILYGHRPPMAKGNLYMAHRCGFTEKVLNGTLRASGFSAVASRKRGHPYYDLYALACKGATEEAELRLLAGAHFP